MSNSKNITPNLMRFLKIIDNFSYECANAAFSHSFACAKKIRLRIVEFLCTPVKNSVRNNAGRSFSTSVIVTLAFLERQASHSWKIHNILSLLDGWIDG